MMLADGDDVDDGDGNEDDASYENNLNCNISGIKDGKESSRQRTTKDPDKLLSATGAGTQRREAKQN